MIALSGLRNVYFHGPHSILSMLIFSIQGQTCEHRFKTAADFRKQLEANLRGHSNKTGESIDRLRRKVAFDRLLARIFTQEPSFFFFKGGYAMELRIARARATKDMDLTWFKRQSNAKEPMSELILQELQMLARINLNDHFIYQIGQPQSEIENAPYGGSQHSVSAIVDNRPFVEFHLDVGGDFLINDVEKEQYETEPSK